MRIDRVPFRHFGTRFHLQVVIKKANLYFSIWADKDGVGLAWGFYNITQSWLDPIFPRKSDWFADNSFKGRLSRMYQDHTRE